MTLRRIREDLTPHKKDNLKLIVKQTEAPSETSIPGERLGVVSGAFSARLFYCRHSLPRGALTVGTGRNIAALFARATFAATRRSVSARRRQRQHRFHDAFDGTGSAAYP